MNLKNKLLKRDQNSDLRVFVLTFSVLIFVRPNFSIVSHCYRSTVITGSVLLATVEVELNVIDHNIIDHTIDLE